MRTVIAAMVSPFLISAFIARVIWISVLAGWESGDRFMETHFGEQE